jgi:hypothetical protein
MAKNKIIDIDAIFDNIEIDEKFINRSTSRLQVLQNPNVIKNLKKGQAKQKLQSDYKTKQKEAAIKRKNHPNLIENLKNTKRNASLAFITPWGIFASKIDAIEFFNKETNSKSGRDYISWRKISNPDQYKNISKEEYNKLILENQKFKKIDFSTPLESRKKSIAEKKGIILTPYGEFLCIRDAWKKQQEHEQNVMKNPFNWFKKMSKLYPDKFYKK